jgi:hypothetical protein
MQISPLNAVDGDFADDCTHFSLIKLALSLDVMRFLRAEDAFLHRT